MTNNVFKIFIVIILLIYVGCQKDDDFGQSTQEIDGLSDQQTRDYLDEIECHVLQRKYRYDHVHQAGDVTIWSNFSTLHNAPPVKSRICRPEDARLMYRVSCKGEPSYHLPRQDTDQWLKDNIDPPYRSTVS